MTENKFLKWAFIAVVFVIAWKVANRNSEPLEKDAPLTQVIKRVLDDEEARPELEETETSAKIRYSIMPWTHSNHARRFFNQNAERLIPDIFTRRPMIDSITIVATGRFTDIRGHSSTDDVAEVHFTRKNAASINWSNVKPENLDKIADHYWSHSSLKD